MLAISFPNINPVAIQFGLISIRWYGIMYVLSIVVGAYIMQKLEKKYKIMCIYKNDFDSLIIYIMLGIIVGGRLGYILFYIQDYTVNDFSIIFKVWQGGMSFHGGVIGVVLATWIFCLRHKKNLLSVTDLIACVAPIGLFFGRIANFINAELYGIKTNVDWAIIFPNTDGYPRHPTQLYEAFAEGILLFIIMMFVIRVPKIRETRGRISGIFLVSYSIFRIGIENFREPDAHIGYILNGITLGQLLSLPMIILGMFLYKRKNLI
jgi:phosphatidylglycerol:prolipoprotein diacylglycerol transferase